MRHRHRCPKGVVWLSEALIVVRARSVRAGGRRMRLILLCTNLVDCGEDVEIVLWNRVGLVNDKFSRLLMEVREEWFETMRLR